MNPAPHFVTAHAEGVCLLAFGGKVCTTTVVSGGFENHAALLGVGTFCHKV